MDKSKIYISSIIVFIIISGFVYINFFQNEIQSTSTQTIRLQREPYNTEINIYDNSNFQNTFEIENTKNTIIIFISGEVENPNVFELPYGSRVIDAIEIAGGATDNADINKINLARIISDSEHIIIPHYTEQNIVTEMQNTQNTNNSSGLININTADSATLQNLPGIGPSISQNIIRYREQHGNFTSIEQIQNVNRIGQNIFNGIRDLITVN
ncbi:MAG: helix-hairpin-helix domain-containing protein [Defluviitaleaceae bacterium]|nr:helix-hairpin-helix domain-containing protein [Defluviitaleaceae bacterium]